MDLTCVAQALSLCYSRTPLCSATIPPVHRSEFTSRNPATCIISFSASGPGNFLTDSGKYEYASPLPEIAPPTRGKIREK